MSLDSLSPALVSACVDLGAIARNTRALCALVPESTRFMAVVKADGYGHGAVQAAKAALENGASWLGVARFNEAESLRRAGIEAPVLVFGLVPPASIDRALGLDLTLTAYDRTMAEIWSDRAAGLGKRLPVHLKVDTGMGRVGLIVPPEENRAARKRLLAEIAAMKGLPGIDLCGIYTHFAAADHADQGHALAQLVLFESLLSDLGDRNIGFQIRHAANSAAILTLPGAHLDMVRAGIALYGLAPSGDVDIDRTGLVPAMVLKTVVTGVRTVEKGFSVSYGMTWKADRPTTLASVPIGYADGFSRAFSSNGSMLVNGIKAPIRGRVCMDQTLIDVGHIPRVCVGDEVVVFGSQKAAVIPAEDLAASVNTINYEIVSALTARVERVYIRT